jgi:hypothetical protein
MVLQVRLHRTHVRLLARDRSLAKDMPTISSRRLRHGLLSVLAVDSSKFVTNTIRAGVGAATETY